MLEGLDQVKWANLWHFQPTYSARIPFWIRDLLSENENVRENAREYIFGEGTEYGKVTKATPYIIPFLVELLSIDSTPEKCSLVGGLSEMEFGHDYNDMPIGSPKDSIRAYEAVANGLPIFLSLLKNQVTGCQYNSVQLLGRLTNASEEIIPSLIEQFNAESEKMIQYLIVESISKLSVYASQTSIYKQSLDFLRTSLDSNDKRTQISAAIGLIKNKWIGDDLRNDDSLFAHIMNILREGFFDYPGPWTDIIKKEIISHLTRLDRIFLLDLLSDRRLSTSQDAHMIVHNLLHSLFEINGDLKYSRYYVNIRKETDGITYSFRANYRIGFTGNIAQQFIDTGIMSPDQIPNLDFYKLLDTALASVGGMFPEKLISPEQKQILKSILDCQPFWELPTNLLSFFYGLPDSRDELRKLIAES